MSIGEYIAEVNSLIHVFYCSLHNKVLRFSLIKQSNAKKAIVDKPIARYYSDRLKCDIEKIETMLTRLPKLQTLNLKRVCISLLEID